MFLRIVFIILLLGGSALTSIFEVEEKWLRLTGSFAFMLGMFGALSQSFVKPKYLEIKIIFILLRFQVKNIIMRSFFRINRRKKS